MPTKTKSQPSRRRADDARTEEHLSIIGKPNVKIDAMAKVTGETIFADDMALPRMLFCKMKRSPHPHARILSVDTSKAEAMPGVVATLVGSERPISFGILPVSQDEHVLAIDKVRFVGDPVAAVAAVDEQTADVALRKIEVGYEVLPSYMSIEEALEKEGEPIHEGEKFDGNVQKAVSLAFGDLDEGFAEADVVREGTYFFEGNTHLAMEQHVALAAFGPDGKLTLWSSTQTPHYVHRAMAKVLEMPPSHIRVVACPNGGGFGGKSDPFNHEMVVAKLSMKTRRPVKVTLTREEVFYCHRGRHPVKMWVKAGVKKDGTDHCTSLPLFPGRRSLRQLRRGKPLLHGCTSDGDLQGEALQVRGTACLHQQAALRPQARPRDPSAAVRHRVSPGQDCGRDRQEPARFSRRAGRRAVLRHRQSSAHPHRGSEGLLRASGGALRLSEQARAAPLRSRHRARGLELHHGRRASYLLEQTPPQRGPAEDRSRRRRDRLLRVDGHRAGLGLGPRLHRGGGARRRNTVDGVQINGASGGAANNVVENNYIGVDVNGTAPLANLSTGVAVFGNNTNNVIGGTAANAGNVISGNDNNGVGISGAGTTGTRVEANRIGTNAAGTAAIPNLRGIEMLSSTSGNTIGGTAANAGNVISGNSNHGIFINGANTNTIQRNRIGTDAAGTADLGNAIHGIEVSNGSSGNLIGGAPADGNVISGNDVNGVNIINGGTSANRVAGNIVGLDSAGSADLGNTLVGVAVGVGATGNIIGEPGGRNIISGNDQHGVRIVDGGTNSNLVQLNYIGTTEAPARGPTTT